MYKVAVIGGCGFIGRRIVSELESSGLSPVSIDDLSYSPFPAPAPDEKINIMDAGVRHLRGADIMVHAAALASVRDCEALPMEAWERNVDSTVEAVNLAVSSGHSKFIYISSCAVYGDIPWNDTLGGECVSPISTYGRTKYAGEMAAASICAEAGISLTILRLANVYGPGQAIERGGVVTLWMDSLRSGQPITIKGDGSQTRDFVYVDDVARIVADECLHDKGGVYTVATGTSVSIAALADMVSSLSGVHDVKVIPEDRPAEEIVYSELQGYDFIFTDLLEGLEETWDALCTTKELHKLL